MFILVDESIPLSVIEVDSPCEIIWVHLYVQIKDYGCDYGLILYSSSLT